MFSNEAWDKKKPRTEKETSEASRRAKEQLLSKRFESGGKLDPEDLKREMIVQRNPVRMYKVLRDSAPPLCLTFCLLHSMTTGRNGSQTLKGRGGNKSC